MKYFDRYQLILYNYKWFDDWLYVRIKFDNFELGQIIGGLTFKL